MAWNNTNNMVQNYAHVHESLPSEERLPQTMIEDVLMTRCECGRHVQAHRIVDTRDLPAQVTNGQKWACDNCWISWIRHDPRHQRTYQGRPFRILDWLELHEAPAENIARQIAIDSELHAKMVAKKQEIVARSEDDSNKPERERARIGRTRELVRLDDNIDRMLDRDRSPVPD
ncbi:hypothetical protein KAR91_71420 [Candidatus Pacearchaeota archaeon]|nr:hypothetical protein [Candidatus Pacearchaeota archaeon]